MIAILIANGFEEIEALTVYDVLKRAECDVKLVGVNGGEAQGAHGISVKMDILAEEIKPEDISMLVLPGGMPGTTNLDEAPITDTLIDAAIKSGAHIAAICAAPMILGKRGLLTDAYATCYPGFEKHLLGARVIQRPVVTYGKITTSRGMGTALPFALELVRILCGDKVKTDLARGLIKEPSENDDCDYSFVKPLESNPGRTEEERAHIDSLVANMLDALLHAKQYAYVRNVKLAPRYYAIKLVPIGKSRVKKITDVLLETFFDVRIVTSATGDKAISVEIPIKKFNVPAIKYQEIKTNPHFSLKDKPLNVPVGVNEDGETVFASLAELPHLIVGGATGMGKSVFVNTLIASLVENYTPDELRLILIDPKRVEFTSYNKSRHLAAPVITDTANAIKALQWAYDEVNRRYEAFSNASVRRISEYNKEAKSPLPYIVIVIDELCDLMIQAKRAVEGLIVSIAQRSRAAGVHFVIATQRPTAQVLTGVIKANMYARVAFKTSSYSDSKAILDTAGAEALLNAGDMLYTTNSLSKVRLQGVFISDSEMCEIMAKDAAEEYDGYAKAVMAEILDTAEENAEDEDGEDNSLNYREFLEDKCFIKAVRVALAEGKISTSLIQRRVNVGYGKAAMLLDAMEYYGIVDEPRGVKPREVIMTRGEWLELLRKNSANIDFEEEEETEPLNDVTFLSLTEDDDGETTVEEIDINEVLNNLMTVEKEIDAIIGVSDDEEEEKEVAPYVPEYLYDGEYVLPTTDTMKPAAPTDEVSDEECEENERRIVETCNMFDLNPVVTSVEKGPRVTRFSLVPAKGERVVKYVGIADDISLNLAAEGIRMEAPVPGKSSIGIEIPNKKPTLVRLKELLDTDTFKTAPSPLTFAVGKGITGDNVYADLCKLPHLLISGATGMGKSIAVYSMLASILTRATPNELKLLLIDPKRVEFADFDNIPHLLTPVIHESKEATAALRFAVEEMERRYEALANLGVRRLEAYNDAVKNNPALGKPLPYIVIVISELNDLMQEAKRDTESLIMQITQKARAAGIHLVASTQRPSVDVVTGVLKANIPSRIAFKVASYADSKTILDFAGAEKLLNGGDMLYMPVGQPRPTRVQGAFISEGELAEFLDEIRKKNEGFKVSDDVTRYIKEGVNNKKEEKVAAASEAFTDPIFIDSVELAIKEGRISTSLIQRKLKIGYNRAAGCLELMEKCGMISEANGQRPRDVLITESDFDEFMKRFKK